MTVSDYQPFVERMIERYEGGYGWDKRDPGGPTKYGITCYDLAEYEGKPMDSMAEWAPIVRAMTIATADQIYQEKYATACQFNALNPGKDVEIFDFGVNSGPSRAIKTAQQLCSVAVDGVLGPITLAAINAYDPTSFINDMSAARLRFLEGLSIWGTFGRGWSARVNDLKGYAFGLIRPQARLSHTKLTRIPMAYAKGWEDVHP